MITRYRFMFNTNHPSANLESVRYFLSEQDCRHAANEERDDDEVRTVRFFEDSFDNGRIVVSKELHPWTGQQPVSPDTMRLVCHADPGALLKGVPSYPVAEPVDGGDAVDVDELYLEELHAAGRIDPSGMDYETARQELAKYRAAIASLA